MDPVKAHMVEQVIKYSDGTETVIKYRGVIVDGVLISEKVESMDENKEEEKAVEAEVQAEAEPEEVAPEEEKASE